MENFKWELWIPDDVCEIYIDENYNYDDVINELTKYLFYITLIDYRIKITYYDSFIEIDFYSYYISTTFSPEIGIFTNSDIISNKPPENVKEKYENDGGLISYNLILPFVEKYLKLLILSEENPEYPNFSESKEVDWSMVL